MTWADLNLLWLVPVGAGPFFVAAVLLHAVWRTYRPDPPQEDRRGKFQAAFAASKPRARAR